jgi:hypothetical protein
MAVLFSRHAAVYAAFAECTDHEIAEAKSRFTGRIPRVTVETRQ